MRAVSRTRCEAGGVRGTQALSRLRLPPFQPPGWVLRGRVWEGLQGLRPHVRVQVAEEGQLLDAGQLAVGTLDLVKRRVGAGGALGSEGR